MGKTGIGDQSVKGATAFADEDNNVVTVLGVSSVNGKGDNVVTVGGGTVTDTQSHCNTIVNVGGFTTSGRPHRGQQGPLLTA